MIYYPLSNPLRTREFTIKSGATISQSGQALVGSMSGGIHGVSPSTADTGQNFVGFVWPQTSAVPFLQTTAVKVETFVVPAGKTVTLAKTPVSATTLVYNVTAGAAVTADSVTGAVVDLTTNGTIGSTVNITYRYTLTVAEARSLNGDVIPGGYAGLTYGQVGVLQAGTIFTDQFDSAVNWLAATAVELAAGGTLTNQGGASNVVVPCSIIAIPSVEYPFLGIEFDAY